MTWYHIVILIVIFGAMGALMWVIYGNRKGSPHPCIGCGACINTGKCVMRRDDARKAELKKMKRTEAAKK